MLRISFWLSSSSPASSRALSLLSPTACAAALVATAIMGGAACSKGNGFSSLGGDASAPSGDEGGAPAVGDAAADAEPPNGSGAVPPASGDGGVSFGGSGDGGAPGSTGCAEAAKLVYVLSLDNDLYSFNPAARQFTRIGTLACQTSMTPNSMSIDRNAVAYVNYVQTNTATGVDTAGAVFKVSTNDASCTRTSIALPSGWYRIGMGFVSDAAGGGAETLYVVATGATNAMNSEGLAKLDLVGNRLVKLGAFTGVFAGRSAELTGTGDARLFGFFITNPVQIAQIDQANGATSHATPMNGVEVPSDWAFSFWGGDFYLYTAPDKTQQPNRTTNVTHHSPATGVVDTSFMTDIGFRIVGAGVSTCAPIAPPK